MICNLSNNFTISDELYSKLETIAENVYGRKIKTVTTGHYIGVDKSENDLSESFSDGSGFYYGTVNIFPDTTNSIEGGISVTFEVNSLRRKSISKDSFVVSSLSAGGTGHQIYECIFDKITIEDAENWQYKNFQFTGLKVVFD